MRDADSGISGRRTTNSLPWPSPSLFATTLPPCIATRLFTEEQKWFRSYPKENIVVSGNENRIPLVLTKPRLPAWIQDGGNEANMTTPAPTHGTFMPTQMNKRHGYTGLAVCDASALRGVPRQNVFLSVVDLAERLSAKWSVTNGVRHHL